MIKLNQKYDAERFVQIILLIEFVLCPLIYYYNAGITFGNDFNVPMRDGAILHTRVFFPKNWNGQPLPVVLSRTPYDIDKLSYFKEYTSKYNVIYINQDLRGTGRSSGQFDLFLSDMTDGYDTINWILKQYWCNGRIATVGGSAGAINLNYFIHHPAIKCATLTSGFFDLKNYWVYRGGVLSHESFGNWLYSLNRHDIYLNIDDIVYPTMSNSINLSVVHITGWYDCFLGGVINTFEYYSNFNNKQILIVGPWAHTIGNYYHPDITYPNNTLNFDAERFIFEEALFQKPKDWSTLPRVFYYVMGDPLDPLSSIEFNLWRNSTTWPLSSSTEKWFFQPNGTLSKDVNLIEINRTIIYDPTNPTKSWGGTTIFTSHIGACDQRSVEDNRTDVLSFSTDVLQSPIEYIGKVQAHLNVISNSSNTDYVVKLMDVFPDGRKIWVMDGILKSNSTDITIDMWSTAYRFCKGHKILVSLALSQYPKYEKEEKNIEIRLLKGELIIG